ncbi:hypothetical protein A6A04_14160 [Paramagnetospirillum marisnigri]|uniref:Uncharacterized protein n=1 Tax=Paramagnetospirillum marisnigri TaxID=1285242 RepID=A0A178MUR3_9PROT|nr:hypothetical protein [Paramagnetospirillum marisnigri]OAN53741.1 hypothetical protein A6A04_14160 [Paramagnetospirillum marisnigri]
MGARGPQHLRKTTNVVLDALVKAVEQAGHGQPLSMGLLETVVAGLKVSANFEDFYHRSYREMMEIVESEKREQRRTNAFGRLMLHPLSPLFQDESLDRALVTNVFSFLHMVLGDEVEIYAQKCKDVVQALKDEMGDHFTWDAFYDDPEAKVVMWHTLVHVAASFKRYDLRKDWFIKLMQYRPTSVSVASNAFVTREHDPNEEPIVFGEHEFCLFFHALFDPLADLPVREAQRFQKEFGADPHHLIGGFLVNLSMCAV